MTKKTVGVPKVAGGRPKVKRKAKEPKPPAWYEKTPVQVSFDRAAFVDPSGISIILEAEIYHNDYPARWELLPGDAEAAQALIDALESWITEYEEDLDEEERAFGGKLSE